MITQNQNKKSGFTLIELLVVIAIIAILAAILFPVFAQAREKARQITCVSNAKQIVLGILQYAQDYDEGMPITFNGTNMYGSGDVQYNTSEPDYSGQQTGIPAEILAYTKSTQIQECPDDHPDNGTEISASKLPNNVTQAEAKGLYYWQIYGTSYKFTNQSETHALTANANADTGYTAIPFCTSAVGTGKVSIAVLGGTATSCDYAAQGETIESAPGPVAGPGMTIKNGNFYFNGTAAETVPTTTIAQSEVTLSMFARPSETRLLGDWVKTWADAPTFPYFHPTGTVIAYCDGHAKFLSSEGDGYYTGCDGIDWAWDQAGSCNLKNLQRNED